MNSEAGTRYISAKLLPCVEGTRAEGVKLRTGLFYKASEFAWANFVHLEEFVFLFIKASACRVSCISGQWME